MVATDRDRLKKVIKELVVNIKRGFSYDEACQFTVALEEGTAESKFISAWFKRCEEGEEKEEALLHTLVSSEVRVDKDSGLALDEILLESFRLLIKESGNSDVACFGEDVVSIIDSFFDETCSPISFI